MNQSEISMNDYNQLEQKYRLALLRINELEREKEQLLDDIRGLIAEEVSKYDPDWVLE